MQPCQDYKEKLILDAHGELDETERFALEGHLKNCEVCRREREQVIRFLKRIQAIVPSPELSSAKSRELTNFIARKIREKHEKSWWRKWDVTGGRRLIPALAAACLIMVALGWFSLKSLNHSPPSQALLGQGTNYPLIAEDMEVIENLNFLEELEVLDQLVERVDDRSVL